MYIYFCLLFKFFLSPLRPSLLLSLPLSLSYSLPLLFLSSPPQGWNCPEPGEGQEAMSAGNHVTGGLPVHQPRLWLPRWGTKWCHAARYSTCSYKLSLPLFQGTARPTTYSLGSQRDSLTWCCRFPSTRPSRHCRPSPSLKSWPQTLVAAPSTWTSLSCPLG